MGKLRFDCYEEFAKRIEFPVVAFKAKSGDVVIMNYEAKLLLGQKTQKIVITIERIADSNRFWTQLHDRKAMVEHHIIISNGVREFPVAGIVNEFEVDGELIYMLLFDQRASIGMNNWMLERIIENSHVIVAHLSFEEQEEIKLNYISRNVKRYGYTCEEFYSGKLQFRDLFHPDDLEAVLGKLAERSRDAQDNDCMEYRIVTESRKVCYVRGNVHFVRDSYGKIESMEIVMMDVTGEKLEKDENQYLRAAIEQSQNVVLVKRFINKKGTVKYVSSNAEMIGLDVEDLRKGKKTFADYILEEDRQMTMDMLMNVQDMPVNNYTNKCRIRGEDGIVRWVKFCMTVENIDPYMYDVELLIQDATDESSYEENLLQNQKALEEKLDYVMSGQVQEPEVIFEEFLTKAEVQEFLEAFAANNQLYAVVMDKDGEMITKPTGPMIRLGEFYDMMEHPKYRERLKEAFRRSDERQRFCIMEIEDGNFEKQIGVVPLTLNNVTEAVFLVAALDEEAVSRLHNSIESFQKLVEIMTKASFDNRYLELDSRKSRLAERAMSEELEGQLILAKAFANMRNDANVTIQEIIKKTCELLQLTSIAVYCGNQTREAYTCIAKWATTSAELACYTEQSWRMAELCNKDEIIGRGGYLLYEADAASLQIEHMASQINSRGMMIIGMVVDGEVYGCMVFVRQEKRVFQEREIAFCQDVAGIIQGILIRKRSTDYVYSLNRKLLNAYNFVSECVFVKEIQTGKVLFANEAMENQFGMDVTGMDSRAFLAEPTPTYTREGVQSIGNISWKSYVPRLNKIMNIQELEVRWENGEDARIVIMHENVSADM